MKVRVLKTEMYVYLHFYFNWLCSTKIAQAVLKMSIATRVCESFESTNVFLLRLFIESGNMNARW